MRILSHQVYNLPEDHKDAIVAIFRAVQELRDAHIEVQNSFTTTLHAEPSKLVEGMIRLADGTDWDPGSGAGLYQYRDAAWRFLG